MFRSYHSEILIELVSGSAWLSRTLKLPGDFNEQPMLTATDIDTTFSPCYSVSSY